MGNQLGPIDGTAYIGGSGPGYVYVTAGGLQQLDGSVLHVPVDAAPTVDAAGEMAVDSSVTDWSHGVPVIYAGEKLGFVVLPYSQFSGMSDRDQIHYVAAADEWQRVAVPLDNLTATSDPTAADDESLGYGPLSRWFNTLTDSVFICKSASSLTAVWIELTGGGTPGGSTNQVQFNNGGVFGGSSGLTWNGTKLTATSISSPGGTGSEAFGSGASAASTESTVVGNGASCSGVKSVVIGEGSEAGGFAVVIGEGITWSVDGGSTVCIGQGINTSAVTLSGNSVLIGPFITVSGTNIQSTTAVGAGVTVGAGTTVFGQGADGSGTNSTAIGASSSATGSSSTALGYSADAAANATAVGYSSGGTSITTVCVGWFAASDGASSSVVVGANSTVDHSNSIVLGANAASTDTNQFVAGSVASPINDAYFGAGPVAASPPDTRLRSSGGSGTNVAGAKITIAGGPGTGTGAGGEVALATAPAGSSGSTANSLVDRLTVDSTGLVQVESGRFAALKQTAVKTSAYTAAVGDLVTVDVSGGTDVPITFPASLSAGDQFGIQLTSDHATAKCTVALNGHTIRNGDRTAGQMSLCLEGDIVVFRYDGSTLQVDEGGLASHQAYVRENAVQTVTHNVWELLEFDTIDWDIGGLADATNDTITVRRDGKYHIMVASYFPSYTTSDTFNVGANKNNATVSTGLIVWDHRQDKSVKAIGEVELSAGDVVRGALYQHDGSASNNDLGHASARYAQNAIYIKEVRD